MAARIGSCVIVTFNGRRSRPAYVVKTHRGVDVVELNRAVFGSKIWAKEFIERIEKPNKGVRDHWRAKAARMAAMRQRRTIDGKRNSWRRIGEKFGVDPVNAYKTVKLHNARLGKNSDGDPLECQAENSVGGNCELTPRSAAPMVTPSATIEGLRP